MVDEVAGFVPAYKVIDLSAPEMAQARRAITLILTRHEPWPAFVLDRDWTVLAANDAAQRLVRLMLGESRMARPMNLMRLFLAPDELRRHIVNWPAWAGALLARTRREAAAAPDDAVLQSVVRDLVALADADQLIAGEGALSPEPLCELRGFLIERALLAGQSRCIRGKAFELVLLGQGCTLCLSDRISRLPGLGRNRAGLGINRLELLALRGELR
jgi:hypothetical protein